LRHDLKDESYRLFPCGRCNTPVNICRGCDRGNRYCLGCAEFARHESLKRARTRHQNTVGARKLHCLRQQSYRQRQRTNRGQGKPWHQPQIESKQTAQQDASNDFVKTIPQTASCNNALSIEVKTKFDLSRVTDQGSPFGSSNGIVVTAAITRSNRQSKPSEQSNKVQCNICGAWCGPFARRKPWHRGRRWTNTQRGKT